MCGMDLLVGFGSSGAILFLTNFYVDYISAPEERDLTNNDHSFLLKLLRSDIRLTEILLFI